MSRTINNPNIAILGDIHGNNRILKRAIQKCGELNIPTLIQVGDFGWDENELCGHGGDDIAACLNQNGVHLYFIPGNHEHWDVLNKYAKGQEPYDFRDNITYMPVGSHMTIGNKECLFVGKAVSIDRDWRIANSAFYFPDEELTDEETDIQGSYDVIFTHDCPSFVEMPERCYFPQYILRNIGAKAETIDACQENREKLTKAISGSSRYILFHGHYHSDYMKMIGDKTIIGINKEDSQNSFAIYNVNTGDLEFCKI